MATVGLDMRGKPLVVVGSINADIYAEIQRLPGPGETITGRGGNVLAGGKGANQAAAAARLGYPVKIVGQVGDDANGKFLLSTLQECGADVTNVRTVESCPSGQAIILLQADGENSIVVIGGANRAWNGLQPSIKQVIQEAGLVLLQREIPPAINEAVAKVAKTSGVGVILDAGGSDEKLSSDLLHSLSILSPNETELASLTGRSIDREEDVIDAAKELMESQGLNEVLVKLGSRGSMVVSRGSDDNVVRQKAFKVHKVVDTTGAGDCFTAAYAVGLLKGKSESEALEYASAAAALCVGRKGAIPSMPSEQEVQAFLINYHKQREEGTR